MRGAVFGDTTTGMHDRSAALEGSELKVSYFAGYRFFFVLPVNVIRRLKSFVNFAMEKCLDLALRKGKAVGETKPTETLSGV